MSYLNQVIRRQAPLTRCQCAVLAVMGPSWDSIGEIWRRRPVYLAKPRLATFPQHRDKAVEYVGYGTISEILRGMVQQGFVERRGGKRPQYRTAKP